MPDGQPIQDLDSVDVVGVRKDGGVDLCVVASSRLDGSPEHQDLVLHKIAGYLGYIASPNFKAEFGNPPNNQITIILSYYVEPDPIMFGLFERCRQWVEGTGVRFRVEARERRALRCPVQGEQEGSKPQTPEGQ